MNKLILVAIVALVGCATRQYMPVNQQPLKDDAAKMGQVDTGMNQQDVQNILGTAVSSSTNAQGFRCNEYALLKFSTNYTQGAARTFFVMFKSGRVVASGESTCSMEMLGHNFICTKYSNGKYCGN